MPRRHVEGTWQKTRAFSPAVVTEGGTTVWVAGHGATEDDTGTSLAGDFDAQVRQAFKNIERTLAAAGGALTDIVSMTVYITDVRHGDRFIAIRKALFAAGRYPASALITVAGFARPEMLVEIMPVAVIGDR
ncbi:MAG: RidA family protein [Proteobacteria bacterium]|nr:RidA family protein [Pseudomonadota bacterium]